MFLAHLASYLWCLFGYNEIPYAFMEFCTAGELELSAVLVEVWFTLAALSPLISRVLFC
jgi:hypothetical protein